MRQTVIDIDANENTCGNCEHLYLYECAEEANCQTFAMGLDFDKKADDFIRCDECKNGENIINM